MRRRGDLQFTHTDAPADDYDIHRVHGFAAGPQGEVVANVSIDMPSARVNMDYGKSWADIGTTTVAPPTIDPDGQLKMPIIEQPAKVSWALANKAGRVAAAPHKLIAALSEEHNVRPVADKTLSPEGSAMSRSANRRGLIQPHPLNPSMEANLPPMFPSGEYGEQLINEELSGHRESDPYWSMPAEERRPVFSEKQMRRAHQRVFPAKERVPEEPAENLRLF